MGKFVSDVYVTTSKGYCSSGKSCYKSALTCAIDAIVMTLAYGETMHVYQCDDCGDYHLTKVKYLPYHLRKARQRELNS